MGILIIVIRVIVIIWWLKVKKKNNNNNYKDYYYNYYSNKYANDNYYHIWLEIFNIIIIYNFYQYTINNIINIISFKQNEN